MGGTYTWSTDSPGHGHVISLDWRMTGSKRRMRYNMIGFDWSDKFHLWYPKPFYIRWNFWIKFLDWLPTDNSIPWYRCGVPDVGCWVSRVIYCMDRNRGNPLCASSAQWGRFSFDDFKKDPRIYVPDYAHLRLAGMSVELFTEEPEKCRSLSRRGTTSATFRAPG
jgi:hypothetical protein